MFESFFPKPRLFFGSALLLTGAWLVAGVLFAAPAVAGEAFDMVRMVRDDLKLYFLEASVEFKKQEYPVVGPAE